MDPLLIVTTALSGIWGNRMDWLATEAGKSFWARFAKRSHKLPGDAPLQLASAEALEKAGLVLHASLTERTEHLRLRGSAKKSRAAWLRHLKKKVRSAKNLQPSQEPEAISKGQTQCIFLLDLVAVSGNLGVLV